MNSTSGPSAITDRIQYYIICSLSSFFAVVGILISILIMVTIIHTKPRLQTVRHMLILYTCIASIFYCFVQTINYIILIFFPNITDDMACRWRGYFGYMSVCAVTYSYFFQTISRLFFSVFSAKYKWLKTFTAHYILILIHLIC